MAGNNGAGGPCRFCGRAPAPGQLRAPGPVGPICADCLTAGLKLTRDRDEQVSSGGTALVEIHAITGNVCEYCGRRERRTFLGGHRPLSRMHCAQSDATICVDCLNQGGDLINRAGRR